MSVAEVAAAVNGRVGSIYHRFASRDVLMVQLWLRSVQRFQTGLTLHRQDQLLNDCPVASARRWRP